MSLQKLQSYLEPYKNIADDLDDEELRKIGDRVCHEYDIDEQSRAEWKEQIDKAMELANQVYKRKTNPWDGASNVKYPLLTNAAIKFASRVSTEIVKGDRIVGCAVIGEDPEKQKAARAKRVSDFINNHLLVEHDIWEAENDRLLHTLPIVGTCFKKSYYDLLKKKVCSELCTPDEIVINNNVKSLESARRVTHNKSMYQNDIIEYIRAGYFRDIETDKLFRSNFEGDEDPIHEILEQHRFLDLDEDGYAEPYIVMVHKESREVLGIYARYTLDSIVVSESGKINKITSDQYFIDFHFIPSPDGKFYSVGFGKLLYPINKAIDSVANQLIDSGTLHNLQGGFVGRGFKIKGGTLKFKMGEWQPVDFVNDDIAKNFYTIPTKEPSTVLFQMLEYLVNAGKELALLVDVLTGDMPAQNVPATTMLALTEQGMKVHNAVQKRLYRAYKKEFGIIYKLIGRYLDDITYQNVLDIQGANLKADFEDVSLDIKPVADPQMSADAKRFAKALAILQFVQNTQNPVGINLPAVYKRYLAELQVENVEELVPPPDPNAKPSSEEIKVQADLQKMMMDGKTAQMKAETDLMNARIKEKLANIKAVESAAKIEKMKSEAAENYQNARQTDRKLDIEEKKVDVQEKQVNAQSRRDRAVA